MRQLKLYTLIKNKLASYYNTKARIVDRDFSKLESEDMILISGESFRIVVSEKNKGITVYVNAINRGTCMDCFELTTDDVSEIISKYPFIQYERNKTIEDILNA